jgi:preprotein translocase subunit SecG
MITLLLRILAVIIGFLILVVVLLKQTSIGIGVRTTQNIFTDQIANIAVSTWLLVVLLVIEIVIVLVLFASPTSRSIGTPKSSV